MNTNGSTHSSSTIRRPNGGIALVHVMEYYDTYNKAFGVKGADVNAVLTVYGGTTFFGLDDNAWDKYQLGEFLQENDPVTKRGLHPKAVYEDLKANVRQ